MSDWSGEAKEAPMPSVMREPEPPRITFEADHVMLQVVIARREDGRKVAETPFNPVKVLYPFDVGEIIRQAEAQARQNWEEQGK